MLPLIVLLSGLAPLYQWREPRWRQCAGWLSADMDAHWARLADPQHPDYGSFNHSAKNVLAEWATLDPQRAGKLFSFALLVLAGLLILK